MANMKYMLFGQIFVQSQGKMMTQVFRTLLLRHSDLVSEALREFTCLSAIDYTQNEDALCTAPSAFLNKQTFQIDEQRICIGTSHSLKQKLSLISRLFRLCGENEEGFILLEQGELVEALEEVVPKEEKLPSMIGYTLFGKQYLSSQAEMMYHVFEEIFILKPELIEWASKHLKCVSHINYTLTENQKHGLPTAFHSCRMFEVGGKQVCVGSSYNLKAKLDHIERLRKQAELQTDVFRIRAETSEPALLYWQEDAIATVLKVLSIITLDGRKGLISMPAGTGKSLVLGELIRRVLNEQTKPWSVLVLTSTANLSWQYKSMLSKQMGPSYTVERPANIHQLVKQVGVPGVILVSTAQSLLARTNKDPKAPWKRNISPYSDSKQLLIIVEEAAYQYFGQTYQDMHAHFPNAAFLGITTDYEFPRRLTEAFGPLLYQYTYAQAYLDGLLGTVHYTQVNSMVSAQAQWGRAQVSSGLSRKIASASEERIQTLTELIVKQEVEKKRQILVLCDNQMEATLLYKQLLPYFKERLKIKLALSPNYDRGKEYLTLSERSPWDGILFPEIVVLACTATMVNQDFDAVYLDREVQRFELLVILSILMRKNKERQDVGELVDLRNGAHRISRLLPDGFPINMGTVANEDMHPDSILQQISDALALRRYDQATDSLAQLKLKFPSMGEQISTQLAFLLPPSALTPNYAQYWQRHATVLAWQSDLWRLLSQDSLCAWKILNDLGMTTEGETEIADTEEGLPAVTIPTSPQARGVQLEQAVKQLIGRLFALSEEECIGCLEQLRVQGAGYQFGFDVTFTYRDRIGMEVTCAVECKNYRNSEIKLSHVAEKLVSLKARGRKIDHWILISPNSKPSNELSELQSKWRQSNEWYPILDVQFWTADEQVGELFGLFPELYAQFYNENEEENPALWSNERRSEIFSRWKAKLAPVPHLPQSWMRYLREHSLLLTQVEADPHTITNYAELYYYRVPVCLLDENELPIDSSAEDYFLQWVHRPDCRHALLLGDFGDGKTFFTYTLARRLVEKFLAAPDNGWIPLRLSLRELGDQPMDFRNFLDQRLREFCDGIQVWNEIQQRYHFLIILDGLDEMSLGMNDTMVLDNLVKLERLIEQFRGHKLLVTSRKMVIYSERVRERILTTLEHPELLHLAPIALGDRLAFLRQLADTPKRRQRLLEIQSTHDLIGLVAKPLFLDMMRIQLDSPTVQVLDAAGIYQYYAQEILNRKYGILLALRGDYTHPNMVQNRLLRLLEELALCLQCKETESISLDEFKTQIGQDDLAQMLWDNADGSLQEDMAEDTERRLSSRTLLKYDCKNHEHRCFCHRSMKEYFVACGVVRKLYEHEDGGRTLLLQCKLGFEILTFAGKIIQGLTNNQQLLVSHNLINFAHETRGKHNHPHRDEYIRLGINSVNLLHFSGLGLQGNDWSELLLDNALLSGANLSGKDFSRSSLRYAHLENADLTGCNLRYCDFTGVQFEKSGQLRAFSILPKEDGILACYKDGKIRCWKISENNSQTLAQVEQAQAVRLFLRDEGRECALEVGGLRFWHRNPNELNTLGYIPLRQGLSVIDVGKENVLIRYHGELCLLRLADGFLLYRCAFPETACACLMAEQLIVLWTAEHGIELWNPERASPLCSFQCEGPVTALCSKELSSTEKVIIIGFGQGKVQCVHLTTDYANGQWEIFLGGSVLTGSDQVLGVVSDSAGGVYASITAGAIIKYNSNNFSVLNEARYYQLELKCVGAHIEGVTPLEQYMVLKKALEFP